MTELPADATHRDAVIDSSNAVAGPEHRKGMSRTERKVETAAATAAAILGGMFSKTQSVTIGTATQFDENQLIAPDAVPKLSPRPADGAGGAPTRDAPAAPDDGPSNADLIPWIKLK